MKTSIWILAVLLFAGAGLAQEEEDAALAKRIEGEVDEYFKAIDKNEDGKLTKAELKTLVKEQTGVKDETDYVFVENYGSWLLDFLAADADDNSEVTRDELAKLLETQYVGEEDPALSKADIKVLETEYYIPAARGMIERLDKNDDDKVSKEEAAVLGDEEGFAEIDSDGDGQVTRDELVKAIHGESAQFYTIPEDAKVGGASDDDDEKADAAEDDVERADAADDAEKDEAEEADTGKDAAEADDGDKPEVPDAIRREFNERDADGDGRITKEELKKQADRIENIAIWWGLYISFLGMDADDGGTVDLGEFAKFMRDEEDGVKHKLDAEDRKLVLDEIWSDLDTDKNGTVGKEEFGKHFPGAGEFDGFDSDEDGELTRDEFWDAIFKNLKASYEYAEDDKSDEEDSPAEDE